MPKKKDRKINAQEFIKKHVIEKTIEGVGNVNIVRPINVVINLSEMGPKAGDGYNFDLTKYYGNGYDDIVNRVYYTVISLLKAKKLRQKTIFAYLNSGFANFADYLAIYHQVLEHDITQTDLNLTAINGFKIHLKDREPPLKYRGQKSYYMHTKSLLKAMHNYNYWNITANKYKDTFPSNPYPESKERAKGHSPLTQQEKRQVVIALKLALQPIININRINPLTSYELTIAILAIAMQTGINTSPLLNMTINSLATHPLKANRKLLIVHKYRGNATQVHNLKQSEELKITKGIKLNVALIIERVIALNQRQRDEINSNLLMIYKEKSRSRKMTSLTDSSLYLNINKFAQKYNFTDDDDNPMVLNLSRIRKSFINGIYELSGEDLIVTAKAAKHSRLNTSNYYLQAPEETKRNLGIMGEIRVKNILSNDTEITPLGQCKDTKYGDRAPKNGKICADFLGCFRCKSFVITGDDLYKLFSFYWAIVRNRDSFGRKDWKRHLRNIITIIDTEIEPEFAKRGMLTTVQTMREKAKQTPHPYWHNLDMLRIGQ